MIRLISAKERLAESTASIALFGRAKIGKTTTVIGLPGKETVVLDLEAGMKAVEGRYVGDSIAIRSFPDAINIVCLLAGPDPAKPSDQFFSDAHHKHCVETLGPPVDPAKYRHIFVDSITELTRLAMDWAKTQPAAYSARTGQPDLRGAYGLLGRQVIDIVKQLQHAPDKNVIFVGGLDRRIDDFGRETFEIQTEGMKVGNELPYIVDEVVTLSDFDFDTTANTWTHNFGKGAHRAFCCRSPNPWGLPAGDRSGRLDEVEEPHLGRLIDKINGGNPLLTTEV